MRRERPSLERGEFEELALTVVASLPPEFRERLENVDIFVQDWASARQLAAAGVSSRLSLLGLYEGVPLAKRQSYSMVLPDRISLFQRAIEARCRSIEELADEVRTVLLHEIGHHFGMDEAWLESIESANRSRPRHRRRRPLEP